MWWTKIPQSSSYRLGLYHPLPLFCRLLQVHRTCISRAGGQETWESSLKNILTPPWSPGSGCWRVKGVRFAEANPTKAFTMSLQRAYGEASKLEEILPSYWNGKESVLTKYTTEASQNLKEIFWCEFWRQDWRKKRISGNPKADSQSVQQLRFLESRQGSDANLCWRKLWSCPQNIWGQLLMEAK